jgi:hypothetical protein
MAILITKAPRFCRWLNGKYGNRISISDVKHPDYPQRWEEFDLLLDGKIIGKLNYNTDKAKEGYKPLDASEVGTVQYGGRLPGYLNELSKDDRATLIWDNSRCVAQSIDEGQGYIEKTPWQRQDGHDTIPFP